MKNVIHIMRQPWQNSYNVYLKIFSYFILFLNFTPDYT